MSESRYEVRIPNIMNPFTVEVNGNRYSFPAGTTQEVNGAVYDVIRNIESMVPTPNPRAGEPSFESLRDRPFWEGDEVLFDQRVELYLLDDGSGSWQMSQALPISAGDSVKVTFDGVVYILEAFALEGMDGIVFFGNGAIAGMEDNGVPFLINTGVVEGFETTNVIGDVGTHSVRIEKSVIHTIDPKFLPGGGGGFNVNVWYESGDGGYVADKTYEQIKAAEAAKTPITGTLTIADGRVFTLIGADDSAFSWVNLVAFEFAHTPSVYVFHVYIYEDGNVEVSTYNIAATKVSNQDVYPK